MSLHRQSRHRQDHGRAAHGRHPAPAGLYPVGPSGVGDARRPGRPVHRPHRAEDQGSAEEGDGRRAVHRRGLLSLSAGERARLRAGGDRDPAAGDGEQARRSGGDPGRLRRPDGPVLHLQSRLPLTHRAPHRLPRLRGGRTAADRRDDAGGAGLPVQPGGAGGVRRATSTARMQPAAFRQRPLGPQRARPRAAAPGGAAVRNPRPGRCPSTT